MTDLIVVNNPNNKWGKHIVEVTLKQWAYETTLTTRVGGNCHGFSVMDTAINTIYDDLLMAMEKAEARIVLVDPLGDELLCEDAERRGESWLKDMLVSCRIIGFEPPTINQVRKINGAAPLPDGDRPWSAGLTSRR